MARSRRYAPILVVVVSSLSSCKDKAEPEYLRCLDLERQGDDVAKMAARDDPEFGIDGGAPLNPGLDPEVWTNAYDACNSARGIAPDSKDGKLAAQKMTELQAKLDKLKAAKAEAARAEAAEKQTAFEQAGGWKAMPTKFKRKFYAQAGSDLTSGRTTPVLDVITGEIGQPTGTYPDAVSVWYVWGAQLGSSASKDDIKGAPFAVRTRSGLACGDYAPNMVEFWVGGSRVWPD